MIYIKDDKILVAAGGLCSNWCSGDNCVACTPDPFPSGQTPGCYSVSFSGVNLCVGESWPGGVDLNTTWRLRQSNSCQWKYEDANWTIYFWFGGLDKPIIQAGPRGSGVFTFHAAGNEPCDAVGSDLANDYNIGDCSGASLGYGGTANWEPT